MTVFSVRQLAPLIGLSNTQLSKHLRCGKFRPEADGSFDVDRVRAALRANLDLDRSQAQSRASAAVAAARPPEPPQPEDRAFAEYNFWRASREKTRAQKEELNLRQRRGELIESAELRAAWAKIVVAVRNRLLLLPDQLAPRLAVLTDVLECRQAAYQEVCATLQTLSENPPEIA